MKKIIEKKLNEPAGRHLASGDYWACDVCGAMGKCGCKIKDMKPEKIAEIIETEIKKYKVNGGYQPEGKSLDTNNPPQGGSGVMRFTAEKQYGCKLAEGKTEDIKVLKPSQTEAIKGKVDVFLYVTGLDKAVADSMACVRVQDSEGNIIEYKRVKKNKK